MKFGMFSNSARLTESPTEDYRADLDEIILADEVGYSEVWVSEHLGSSLGGAMPTPELLIAKASALTSNIRLGSGVRLLPLFHPFDVATQAAVNDHLTDGRYNLGVGTGFPLLVNYSRRGLSLEERVPRTVEAFDFVMKCLTNHEPFDFAGEYYQGYNVSLLPRPLQQPHPPVTFATSSSPDVLRLAAEGGHGLIFAQNESPESMRARIDQYVSMAEAAGVPRPREAVRVSRMIFVAEEAAEARKAMKFMIDGELDWRRRWAAGGAVVPNPYVSFALGDETLHDMSFDLLYERGALFVGDPDEVAQQLGGLFDEVGGFGTIVYVSAKNFGSRALELESIRLFATDVVPRLASYVRAKSGAQALQT